VLGLANDATPRARQSQLAGEIGVALKVAAAVSEGGENS
jgi:hypothetical protein